MLDIPVSDPRMLVAGVDWLLIVGCIVVCIVRIVVVVGRIVVVVGRIVVVVVVVGRIVVVVVAVAAVAVVVLCLVDHLIGTCHPCHPSFPSFPSYLDTTCNTFASYMCSASDCYSSQLVPSMDIPFSCSYTYHQQQGKRGVEQPLHLHLLLRIHQTPSVRKVFRRQHCCTIVFVLHHQHTRRHHRMEQGCCMNDFVSDCHHHMSLNKRSMRPIHPSYRQHLEFHKISFQLLVQHSLHYMDS